MKLMLTLYTYAEGARCQVISVLSHLGLTSSYTSFIGSWKSQKTQEVGLAESDNEDDPSQVDEDIASAGSESADEESSECEFEEDDMVEVVERVAERQDAGANGADEETSGSDDSTADDGEWTDVDNSEVDDSDSVQPAEDDLSHGDAGATVEQVEGETQRGEDMAQPDEDDGTESGYLNRLSAACRRAARREASSGLLGFVYDNINTVFRSAEQILGRKDSRENSTCATAFTLLNAYATTPTTSDKIADHKTKIFPLPSMPIDESSITGNAEVVTEIFRELGIPFDGPDFADSQDYCRRPTIHRTSSLFKG